MAKPEDAFIQTERHAGIVSACSTIRKCANQLSLTLHRLGEVGRGIPEMPPGESLASELDRRMAELDDKIGQILSAVRRIGHDLGAEVRPMSAKKER